MCVGPGRGGGGGATEFSQKVCPTTYLGLSPKAIIFITHDYIEK